MKVLFTGLLAFGWLATGLVVAADTGSKADVGALRAAGSTREAAFTKHAPQIAPLA
jgi:hypothetical protein